MLFDEWTHSHLIQTNNYSQEFIVMSLDHGRIGYINLKVSWQIGKICNKLDSIIMWISLHLHDKNIHTENPLWLRNGSLNPFGTYQHWTKQSIE